MQGVNVYLTDVGVQAASLGAVPARIMFSLVRWRGEIMYLFVLETRPGRYEYRASERHVEQECGIIHNFKDPSPTEGPTMLVENLCTIHDFVHRMLNKGARIKAGAQKVNKFSKQGKKGDFAQFMREMHLGHFS